MSIFNLLAQQLSSADSDVNIRSEVATKLSNDIRDYTGPTYAAFLKQLVPIFISCLKGPPVSISTSPEQKLRIRILTILYQLPKNPPEPFEPYTKDVMDLLISLVYIDNEESASLCIKIIIDIMRHQTKVLRDKLQKLLALTVYMFDHVHLVVRDRLDNQAPYDSLPGVSVPESSLTFDNSPRSTTPISDVYLDLQQPTLPLPKGMASFKVLGECPIIVQLIFEVYRPSDSLDINLIFLRIKTILLLQAKPQERAHAAAAAEGTIFTGFSPNISNRAVFGEFVGTQVKAISLLAYLLRNFMEQLTKLAEFNDFLPTLPDIVIRLLKDCPRGEPAVRQELLKAIRLININCGEMILKHIDRLLDRRILLGDSLTVYETQRPLAYSMLADLICHNDHALEPAQIRKIVEVYTKNLQDNFPGTSFQNLSAKLLLNMTGCIAKMPNKVDARYYLILILNAIGNKFAAIEQQYPNAVKLSELYAQLSIDASPHTYLVEREPIPDWVIVDIFTATPIKTSNPLDRGADPVKDNKFLFKSLINGLEDIFYKLKSCQIGSPIRFTAEEIQVISKLFRKGANVFRYYTTGRPTSESQYISALEVIVDCYISGTEDGKNLLETFVRVLRHVDPTTLHEIFHDQIPIALGRAPQLSKILPTLVQQYYQMNHHEALLNNYATSWFDLFIGPVLDIEKENHRARTSSIQVTPRKNLMGPLHEIWFAATSCARMEPSYKRIDNGWSYEKEALIAPNSQFTSIHHEVLDLEKRALGTRNSPFQAAVCKSLIWPVQKLSFAATSWFYMKPSVEAIIDAMLHVKKGVVKSRNNSFRAALCKTLIRLFQRICVEATSSLCMESSVKIIIDAVLDIEEAVQRTQNSTFRAILYKYWNRFPQEVCSFLFGKIKELKYGRFFAQILEHPKGGPLRKIVVEKIGILIKISGDMEAEQDISQTAVINTVHIVHSLCKFRGIEEWMDEENIIIWFNIVGKNLEVYLQANTLSPKLRLAAEQASEQLMVIFTKFLERHPTDLDTLFGLVESVANEDLRQTHPFLTYIYDDIICNKSIEYQKMIVLRSLEVYANKSASQRTKTFLLHNIVNPIVAMDVMRMSKEGSPRNYRLMDMAIINSIHTKIWKVSFGDPNEDLTLPGIDHTRMEAFQLTAILVKYHHLVLQCAREDIIKFACTYIHQEDVIMKHAAYVLIGYFIAHYDTSASIIKQVYLLLLKTNQDESRVLVAQALELITPVLIKLCNATPEYRDPIWVVAPCRILTEQRQNVRQKTTVFYVLTRYADDFYEYRDKFIVHIIKLLGAIAQLPDCSAQSKKQVLELMTLVCRWEQQRVEGKECLTIGKRKLENSDEQLITLSPLSMGNSTSADKSEYKIPTWARAEMITYLARFILSNHLPLPQKESSMAIFDSLLLPQYWGDLDIRNSDNSEICARMFDEADIIGQKAVWSMLDCRGENVSGRRQW